MKILILGGTVFLGRHLVEAALAAGHEVTMFNRGRTNPGLFPAVEELLGDRADGLGALRGRRWDAVIDTSGYLPRVVQLSLDALVSNVDRYVFVSTISVFANFRRRGMDESAGLGRLEDPSSEDAAGAAYGPLKAICEEAVEATFPGRALLIRPGLIVGPHDPTDRFTYWPLRVERGGEVLAPVGPTIPTQFIDVRDLAGWTLRMVEAKATGVFNATGPGTPLTFGEVFETCRMVAGSDATPVWVPEQFVREMGIAPWAELPLWTGGGDEMAGFAAIDCRKAISKGLSFRPLSQTVEDTLAWAHRRIGAQPKAGLAPEKEAAALDAWHHRESKQEANNGNHGV